MGKYPYNLTQMFDEIALELNLGEGIFEDVDRLEQKLSDLDGYDINASVHTTPIKPQDNGLSGSAQTSPITRQLAQLVINTASLKAIASNTRAVIGDSADVVKTLRGTLKTQTKLSIGDSLSRLTNAPLRLFNAALDSFAEGATSQFSVQARKEFSGVFKDLAQVVSRSSAKGVAKVGNEITRRTGFEDNAKALAFLEAGLDQINDTAGHFNNLLTEMRPYMRALGSGQLNVDKLIDGYSARLERTLTSLLGPLANLTEVRGLDDGKRILASPQGLHLQRVYSQNLDITDPVRDYRVGEAAQQIKTKAADNGTLESFEDELIDSAKQNGHAIGRAFMASQNPDGNDLGLKEYEEKFGRYISEDIKFTRIATPEPTAVQQFEDVTGVEGMDSYVAAALRNTLVGGESAVVEAERIYDAIRKGISGSNIKLMGHSSGGTRVQQTLEVLQALAEIEEDSEIASELRKVQGIGTGAAPFTRETEGYQNLVSRYDSFVGGLAVPSASTNLVENAAAFNHEAGTYLGFPGQGEALAKFFGMQHVGENKQFEEFWNLALKDYEGEDFNAPSRAMTANMLRDGRRLPRLDQINRRTMRSVVNAEQEEDFTNAERDLKNQIKQDSGLYFAHPDVIKATDAIKQYTAARAALKDTDLSNADYEQLTANARSTRKLAVQALDELDEKVETTWRTGESIQPRKKKETKKATETKEQVIEVVDANGPLIDAIERLTETLTRLDVAPVKAQPAAEQKDASPAVTQPVAEPKKETTKAVAEPKKEMKAEEALASVEPQSVVKHAAILSARAQHKTEEVRDFLTQGNPVEQLGKLTRAVVESTLDAVTPENISGSEVIAKTQQLVQAIATQIDQLEADTIAQLLPGMDRDEAKSQLTAQVVTAVKDKVGQVLEQATPTIAHIVRGLQDIEDAVFDTFGGLKAGKAITQKIAPAMIAGTALSHVPGAELVLNAVSNLVVEQASMVVPEVVMHGLHGAVASQLGVADIGIAPVIEMAAAGTAKAVAGGLAAHTVVKHAGNAVPDEIQKALAPADVRKSEARTDKRLEALEQKIALRLGGQMTAQGAPRGNFAAFSGTEEEAVAIIDKQLIHLRELQKEFKRLRDLAKESATVENISNAARAAGRLQAQSQLLADASYNMQQSVGARGESTDRLSNRKGQITKLNKESLAFLKSLQKEATEEGTLIGEFVTKGLAEGLNNEEANEAAIRVSEAVLAAFRSGFKIASPSKVMIQYGKYLDEGLALGLSQQQAELAAKRKVTALLKYLGDDLAFASNTIADFEAQYAQTIEAKPDISRFAMSRLEALAKQRAEDLAEILEPLELLPEDQLGQFLAKRKKPDRTADVPNNDWEEYGVLSRNNMTVGDAVERGKSVGLDSDFEGFSGNKDLSRFGIDNEAAQRGQGDDRNILPDWSQSRPKNEDFADNTIANFTTIADKLGQFTFFVNSASIALKLYSAALRQGVQDALNRASQERAEKTSPGAYVGLRDEVLKEANKKGLEFTSLFERRTTTLAALDPYKDTVDTTKVAKDIDTLVAGLAASPETADRIKTAIAQGLSKGVASSEELFQQLGDAVPGVAQELSAMRNTSVARVRKDIAQGGIQSVDVYPELVSRLAQNLELRAEAFADSYQGRQNRIQNLKTEVSANLGESSLPAVNLLQQLHEALLNIAIVLSKGGAVAVFAIVAGSLAHLIKLSWVYQKQLVSLASELITKARQVYAVEKALELGGKAKDFGLKNIGKNAATMGLEVAAFATVTSAFGTLSEILGGNEIVRGLRGLNKELREMANKDFKLRNPEDSLGEDSFQLVTDIFSGDIFGGIFDFSAKRTTADIDERSKFMDPATRAYWEKNKPQTRAQIQQGLTAEAAVAVQTDPVFQDAYTKALTLNKKRLTQGLSAEEDKDFKLAQKQLTLVSSKLNNVDAATLERFPEIGAFKDEMNKLVEELKRTIVELGLNTDLLEKARQGKIKNQTIATQEETALLIRREGLPEAGEMEVTQAKRAEADITEQKKIVAELTRFISSPSFLKAEANDPQIGIETRQNLLDETAELANLEKQLAESRLSGARAIKEEKQADLVAANDRAASRRERAVTMATLGSNPITPQQATEARGRNRILSIREDLTELKKQRQRSLITESEYDRQRLAKIEELKDAELDLYATQVQNQRDLSQQFRQAVGEINALAFESYNAQQSRLAELYTAMHELEKVRLDKPIVDMQRAIEDTKKLVDGLSAAMTNQRDQVLDERDKSTKVLALGGIGAQFQDRLGLRKGLEKERLATQALLEDVLNSVNPENKRDNALIRNRARKLTRSASVTQLIELRNNARQAGDELNLERKQNLFDEATYGKLNRKDVDMADQLLRVYKQQRELLELQISSKEKLLQLSLRELENQKILKQLDIRARSQQLDQDEALNELELDPIRKQLQERMIEIKREGLGLESKAIDEEFDIRSQIEQERSLAEVSELRAQNRDLGSDTAQKALSDNNISARDFSKLLPQLNLPTALKPGQFAAPLFTPPGDRIGIGEQSNVINIYTQPGNEVNLRNELLGAFRQLNSQVEAAMG